MFSVGDFKIVIEFHLPISTPFSPTHTYYFPLVPLELRIYTLLGPRLPKNLINGMDLLPRKMLYMYIILCIISGICEIIYQNKNLGLIVHSFFEKNTFD